MSDMKMVVLVDDEDGPCVFRELLSVPKDLDLAAVKAERRAWYYDEYLPYIRQPSTMPRVEYRSLLDFLKERGAVVVPVEVWEE